MKSLAATVGGAWATVAYEKKVGRLAPLGPAWPGSVGARPASAPRGRRACCAWAPRGQRLRRAGAVPALPAAYAPGARSSSTRVTLRGMSWA